MKGYYEILTNKKCCDDSIESVILGYILVNIIPNFVFDCFNISNYIYNIDMEIYKVQGPYTFIAMIVPLVLIIVFILITICVERCKYKRLSTMDV